MIGGLIKYLQKSSRKPASFRIEVALPNHLDSFYGIAPPTHFVILHNHGTFQLLFPDARQHTKD